MNIIPLNIESTFILVSCYLVHSYLNNPLPFTSLSSCCCKVCFLLPKCAGYIWAWICLCSLTIWVLWYAMSFNQLSQTLCFYCSGFPPLFSLYLPDAASFWIWLEGIQSVLLSVACLSQLLFDLISPFFSFLPSPFRFNLVPEFHYLIDFFR